MPLINCEISLILTWSAKYFKIDTPIANQVPTFGITVTKFINLSTQDNAKLLQQLILGFKRTTNWNKYQSKATVQEQNQYLDYLIGPSFQGVNRLFILSFKNSKDCNWLRRWFHNWLFPGIFLFQKLLQDDSNRIK